MKVIKVKDYTELSEAACTYMLERLQAIKKPVLGLATGSTPEGLYQKLIDKYKSKEISFEHTTTFNLDEYVGLPPHDVNSYHHYMHEKLFNHINIKKENIHLLNGVTEDLQAECEAYEASIRALGPIDIQILGIGENGHIGFNEPGTSFSSRTQIVDLKESTREANARYFNSIEEVPTHAVSMGIKTIMESKSILLIASGEKKAKALARLIDGEINEESPGSVLNYHSDATIIADEVALSKVKSNDIAMKEKLPV